jgi:hypothetical protein
MLAERAFGNTYEDSAHYGLEYNGGPCTSHCHSDENDGKHLIKSAYMNI